MVNCLLRFLKARDGVAAVELALLSPVLATMVIGILDFGGAVYTAVQVEAAARSGAQYGWSYASANANNVSGTHTAVTNGVTAALPNGTPSYPGQTDYLYSLCVPTSGSSLGTPVVPGVSCGSGNTKNTYVGVTVTDGAMIPVPFFGLGSTLTVTGQAILRVSSADTLRTLQS
jgi:Flp pilus assembly protein TadG